MGIFNINRDSLQLAGKQGFDEGIIFTLKHFSSTRV